MEKLRRIQVPNDSLDAMDFGPAATERMRRYIREAQESGKWEQGCDYEISLDNLEFWAYWFYKTRYVVEKPRPGSGLEELLRPPLRTRYAFDTGALRAEEYRTLSAAGDLMTVPGLEASADKLYEGIADILFDADVIHANLESTLSRERTKNLQYKEGETVKINITPAAYQAVIRHRGRQIDVVTLANNHILDCGEEGVAATLEQLRRDGVRQVGVFETEEESRKPQITETGGVRIGWVTGTWCTNGKPFPEGKPWLTNILGFHVVQPVDLSRTLADIRACREAGCELVVATLHWGLEHELYPHPDQLLWAQQLADAGVDLIIGHHPHVPQLHQILHPRGDGSKSVPVLYSLGNLTSVISNPATVLSLVARVRIAKGSVNGAPAARIAGLELTPVALAQEDGPALRLRKVKELLEEPGEPEWTAYVGQVARFADIVAGTQWRQE